MINETDILRKLPELLPSTPRIATGAGDDCAVINMPGGSQLLAAVDQLIENIHFLPVTPPETAGKKLMNRNLSDIAAMGGTPLTALLTVSVNGKTSGWVESFIKGAADAGMVYDVSICGGDTASLSAPGFAATLTILGEIPEGKAVLRSGASAGELLYITGCIGNSFYSEHHLNFVPRLKEGAFLRDKVSAMLDISDGLLLDAARLAESSGVTLELDLSKVPLRTGAKTPDAFSDGEDYELLFTSKEILPQISGLADITCIGRVIGKQNVPLVDPDGTPIITEKSGYVHR